MKGECTWGPIERYGAMLLIFLRSNYGKCAYVREFDRVYHGSV